MSTLERHPVADDLVQRTVSSLQPIGLDELNASARLMTRVDRKYFVPRHIFAAMLAHFADSMRVLEIGGMRQFDYHSVYFDTDDFALFRQHAQGRRRRNKVRTRTYVHSGQCFLEVKAKGYRGRTEKFRQPHDPHRADALTGSGREHVDRHLDGTGVHAAALRPHLATDYRRMTLVAADAEQRITCDTDLEFHSSSRWAHGPADVLVETKSGAGAGPLDRWLIHMGVREHSVSKYCVAAAVLNPHLKANRWHRLIHRNFVAGRNGYAPPPQARNSA